MSVAETELELPDMCEEHGAERPCRYCRLENIDEYADAQYEDSINRRSS